MQKRIKPIEGLAVSFEKFDASHPHTHGGRVYREAKEPIEKSHNEPETRKKEKTNPQSQQADKESDERDGYGVNKPSDETLEVLIIIIGGVCNRIR